MSTTASISSSLLPAGVNPRAPTVFDHVKPDMHLAQHEVFSPVLAIIRVKDEDEAKADAESADEAARR